MSAKARELILTATQLHDTQAGVDARGLRVRVNERVGAASVEINAEHVDVPTMALSGSLAWSCTLGRDDSGIFACDGPVDFADEAGLVRKASLGARMDGKHIDLELSREGSRIVLALPFAAREPAVATLRQVPANWLKAPLARLWKGSDLRAGIFDADAQLRPDGAFEAQYRADGLAWRSPDGRIASDDVALAGELRLVRDGNVEHIVADAVFNGGAIQAGDAHIRLPDRPVTVRLDASQGSDGSWKIAQFAWNDPDVLEFSANAQLDPVAKGLLRSLAVHVDHARLPMAISRYAQAALSAHDLGGLALDGEVSGDLVIDEKGIQRFALASPRLDVQDAAHDVSVKGVHGRVDWAREGERPAANAGWRSASINGNAIPAASARWHSVDGTLRMLSTLRMKLPSGDMSLERTVIDPDARGGMHISTSFTLRDAGVESGSGAVAAAHVSATGHLNLSQGARGPHLQMAATLRSGEALVGAFYLKLPTSGVTARLDAIAEGDRWHVGTFEWRDPGVLDVAANGEISLHGAKALQTMHLDLRYVDVASALSRYAQSWLATRGYGKLSGQGTLAGTLQLDEDGVRRFAFDAHDVDLRDGEGRFAFMDVNGGVDWDSRRHRAATALGWHSIELFRVPLGAATARLESRRGRIVLAQPLDIDALGGRIRLEKLGLRPRSPRGERYSAAFAIVGIDMAQLSDAFGWPRMGGNLSGGIPHIVFDGDTIDFDGGLDLYVFDGHLGVSGLTLERPFGIAPSLGAAIHFENLDLVPLTQAFSFGSISGRLYGTIDNLRLVDWRPVQFDAWLRTKGGGRMSYKAVDDLSSIGGGGLSSNLQTMALKLFKSFGYRRLGIRCTLRDEVCAMGGIDPIPPATARVAANRTDAGYTIVDGSSLPRITIVGNGRRVDWPTLVRRLVESTQGQGPVVR